MSIFDRLKSLPIDKIPVEKVKDVVKKRDGAEWDAVDPAGDESLYPVDYAAETPYDHSQFEEVAEDGDN